MKVIYLRIDKAYTHIAGYEYGELIYNEQVKPFFNGSDKLEIKFPNHIKGIAISFVQGLINGMLKIVPDRRKLIELITMKAPSDYLTNKLYDDAMF